MTFYEVQLLNVSDDEKKKKIIEILQDDNKLNIALSKNDEQLISEIKYLKQKMKFTKKQIKANRKMLLELMQECDIDNIRNDLFKYSKVGGKLKVTKR